MQDAKNVKQRQFSKSESCRCLCIGAYKFFARFLMSSAIEGLASYLVSAACRVGIDRTVFRDGLRCLTGHFRLYALMLVEEIIKTLCIQTPIIIQDMCILLCDHRSLCMAGVTLNGFDITAVQFEFVCNTGVSEAMKDHFGEIVFLNQLLQCTVDGGLFGRHSQRAGDHKIIVSVPSTYRSFPQWEIIAFVTDVAHHHRNVTEECVFNFQGAG